MRTDVGAGEVVALIIDAHSASLKMQQREARAAQRLYGARGFDGVALTACAGEQVLGETPLLLLRELFFKRFQD